MIFHFKLRLTIKILTLNYETPHILHLDHEGSSTTQIEIHKTKLERFKGLYKIHQTI